MSKLPEYNGWVNHPTWCVYTWLTGEDDGRDYLSEQVAGVRSAFKDDHLAQRTALAGVLKDDFLEIAFIIGDDAAGLSPAGMVQVMCCDELLQYSLCHVDWEDLAERFLTEGF